MDTINTSESYNENNISAKTNLDNDLNTTAHINQEQKTIEEISLLKRKIESSLISSELFSNKNEIEQALEPFQVFERIKNSIQFSDLEKLRISFETYQQQIEQAKRNGQEKLVYLSILNSKIILKEMLLNTLGVNKFILSSDLMDLQAKIQPENSIKIIELSRYSRFIPEEASKKIQFVREKNIFDLFYVVYTDLTQQNKSDLTEEEKKQIERNRDPIVFGVFKSEDPETKGIMYHRFYFIADWIDEYCDLTLDKLVNLMAENKVSNDPIFSIDTTHNIINNFIQLENEKLNDLAQEIEGNKTKENSSNKDENFLNKILTKIKNLFN